MYEQVAKIEIYLKKINKKKISRVDTLKIIITTLLCFSFVFLLMREAEEVPVCHLWE